MAGGFWSGLTRFANEVEAAFTAPKGRRLMRPRYPRKIAGVCSGVAEYFGWDATLLRVVVIVLAVASSGLVVLGYLAGWVLIPEGQYSLPEQRMGSSSF